MSLEKIMTGIEDTHTLTTKTHTQASSHSLKHGETRSQSRQSADHN